MRNDDEWLRLFNELKMQHERVMFTKKWMAYVLQSEGLDEEHLEETEMTAEEFEAFCEADDQYTHVDTFDIVYDTINGFKCFKLIVEEVIYTYFISPDIVLTLDNDNIID